MNVELKVGCEYQIKRGEYCRRGGGVIEHHLAGQRVRVVRIYNDMCVVENARGYQEMVFSERLEPVSEPEPIKGGLKLGKYRVKDEELHIGDEVLDPHYLAGQYVDVVEVSAEMCLVNTARGRKELVLAARLEPID